MSPEKTILPRFFFLAIPWFDRASSKRHIIKLEQKEKKLYLKLFRQKNVEVHIDKNITPNSSKEKPIGGGVRMIEISARPQKDAWTTISILIGNNIEKLKKLSPNKALSLMQ